MTLIEAAKDYINKRLPDRTKASDPMYPAGVVREVFFKVLDVSQGLISELRESFSTKNLKAADINDGLRLNYAIQIVPEAGKPADRYFRIATFQAEDFGNLADSLRLLATYGKWESARKNSIDLHMSNRGGFKAYPIAAGDDNGGGFAVYPLSGKRAALYLRMPNTYFMASISIVQCYQVAVHDTWIEEVPTGQPIYNSLDRLAYPAPLQLGSTSVVPGFFRTGVTNMGFQLTGYRTAGSQTLNPNSYIELKLEDGNIIKVAVLN